jgi:hypothetical protein
MQKAGGRGQKKDTEKALPPGPALRGHTLPQGEGGISMLYAGRPPSPLEGERVGVKGR